MGNIKPSNIPNRLRNVSAEHPYVAGAVDIYDDALGKPQSQVNQERIEDIAEETQRAQAEENLLQGEINALSRQNYVTVDSYSDLPDLGAVDTIYRVSNWDGTQVDATKYAEYAWNNTGIDQGEYVLLDVKTQVGEVFDISLYKAVGGVLATFVDLSAALDGGNNVPAGVRQGGMSIKFVQSSDNNYVQYRLMSDEWSINNDDWSIYSDSMLVDNPEYIYVLIDSKGRIIDAIYKDGTTILGNKKVDKEKGKSLIDEGVALGLTTEDNPEFLKVIIDEKGNILGYINKAGEVYIQKIKNPTVESMSEDLPKIKNDVNFILDGIYNSCGDYIAQNRSVLDGFRNTVVSQTYHRKLGNIWIGGDDEERAINPLTKYEAADPSYIKVGKYFYLFKTTAPCYIDRSEDMINWEKNYSRVFPEDFDYSQLPNFSRAWANDINYIDGKYVDYIAIYTGDPTTTYTIAMYSESIDGPWTYGGIVCKSLSDGGPVEQPIDPEYVVDTENNNQGYLIVGSFQDLVMAPLSTNGLEVTGEWTVIAKRLNYNLLPGDANTNHCGEGSFVYKYTNSFNEAYYYLFVSLGVHTSYAYRIAIARSQYIDSERVDFINKSGEHLIVGGNWNADASVILSADEGDVLNGPGHNGEIYTDADGNMYTILHCHATGALDNDSLRPIIIMRIVEDTDGWLAFADKDGNIVTKPTFECSVPHIING